MDHSTFEEASSTAYITTKYLEGISCKECKKEFVKMITDKTSQFKPSSSCPAWYCKTLCGAAYCSPYFGSTIVVPAGEGCSSRKGRKRQFE
jgi:hypothetical protein